MARLNVNPTRMELSKLKKRLTTARRGHKLLKDKRDELMKQFLTLARQNRSFRREVEAMLQEAYASFIVARAVMSDDGLEEALMFPKQSAGAEVTVKNIMSVNVPEFHFQATLPPDQVYAYGLAETSGELDQAVFGLSDLFPKMLELAELEKTCDLLAQEIEKTRRRVNALEHVMIPQLEETIQFITMKLEENERGNITRLMKVKDLMLKEQLGAEK
ncbi:MAG: V-type ATP synthase subunit D [Clostridia bacterium]